MDRESVHAFISDSGWAKDIPKDILYRAIENSIGQTRKVYAIFEFRCLSKRITSAGHTLPAVAGRPYRPPAAASVK